jgi:hypothetical protein
MRSVRSTAASEGTPVEVALIMADGSAWGTSISVGSEWSDVAIPLDRLSRVPLVLLPRPFPGFLPYDLTSSTAASAPTLSAIEAIQWGFRRAAGTAGDSAMQIELERVELHLPPTR